MLRIGLLENEKRVQTQRKPAGPLGAMLVGIAFAFGWTPCIGPILGGILPDRSIARTPSSRASNCWPSIRSGWGSVSSTSIAINQFFAATTHPQALPRDRGRVRGLLIVVGVLIFTNQFTLIVRYLQPYLPVY